MLWLPAAAWLVGTPVLFVWAEAQSITFLGELVSPEQARATAVRLVWAALCCAGAPLAGLGVAWIVRSSRALRLYGIAFVIGCLPGLFWTVSNAERSPAPTERVPTCQEHSGGDTRCPGG